ncbi:MAG: HAMP domain-containing histidine kinase [Chloroflexi bacterium]|nr:HAMP domain-containing histidine kinase [Chloroflexota bacterium]
MCAKSPTPAPAFPPNIYPHLTQQFYRGRRDEPGSGLGLAIVEEIVRQHNGRLSITSHTEGAEKGTAVTFSLPILSHFTPTPIALPPPPNQQTKVVTQL